MPRTGQVPSPLEIRLFGPFRVTVDGQPLRVRKNDKLVDPLKNRESRWLLAALALRHGQDVPRETLAEVLFPSDGPKVYSEEQARDSLGKSLKELLSTLGERAGRIVHTPRTIRLDLQGAYVDVAEFERAWQREEWERAVEHHGDGTRLLEGCPDALAEYVEEESIALQNKFVRCLENAALRAAAVGEWEEAQHLARRALDVDPSRSRPYHALMEAAAGLNRPLLLKSVFKQLCNVSGDPTDPVEMESQQLYDRLTALMQRCEAEADEARQKRHSPFTPHNIPKLPAPLIGREKDLEEVLKRLYAPDKRLVTLWGPGGVGKTWLALKAADEIKDRYRDGAWFVDLTPLPRDAGDQIPRQIALALRLNADLEGALLDALENSDRLLVLNNCEHLRSECAALVDRLRARCGRIRVLVTSQQGLDVSGEVVWPVRPLRAPTQLELERGVSPEVLTRDYAAAKLFASRIQPELTVTAESAPAVAQICARLGGIPLALVMAAARTRPPTVRRIAEILAADGRFEILTEGERTEAKQHQTLRDLLDWSYALLPEDGPERPLFRALSVFVDGWPPEAVAPVSGLSKAKAFDASEELVRKALVDGDRPDGRQFLLETMKLYAWHKIKDTPEGADVTGRFLTWCCTLVDEAAEELDGPEQKRWLGMLETEHGNLRAGLCHYRDQGRWTEGLRLAARLWPFWNTRNHWREGRDWLELFLAHPTGEPENRASAHNGAAVLAIQFSDFEQALAHVRTAREIAEGLGPKLLADVLSTLGFLMAKRGTAKEIPPEARGENLLAFYHRAMREQPEQAIHAERSTFWPLWGLSKDAEQEGHLEEAARRSEDALQVAKRHGNLQQQTLALGTLGIVAQKRGLWSEAAKRMTESLQVAQDLPDLGRVAACLEDFARLAMGCADWKAAVLCCSFAKEAREIEGVTDDNSDNNYPEIIGPCLSHLSDEVYRETWAAGRGLTREGLLQFVPPSVT